MKVLALLVIFTQVAHCDIREDSLKALKESFEAENLLDDVESGDEEYYQKTVDYLERFLGVPIIKNEGESTRELLIRAFKGNPRALVNESCLTKEELEYDAEFFAEEMAKTHQFQTLEYTVDQLCSSYEKYFACVLHNAPADRYNFAITFKSRFAEVLDKEVQNTQSNKLSVKRVETHNKAHDLFEKKLPEIEAKYDQFINNQPLGTQLLTHSLVVIHETAIKEGYVLAVDIEVAARRANELIDGILAIADEEELSGIKPFLKDFETECNVTIENADAVLKNSPYDDVHLRKKKFAQLEKGKLEAVLHDRII